MQRIYDRQFARRIYSGSTAHGQSFIHLDDLLDALILLGESESLSYDELQHTFARLILGEDLQTLVVPAALAPLAKAGAWVMDELPGADPFLKPWMIDRADDHYALDITSARTLLGWEPKRSLRETPPKMVAALKADPAKFYQENKLSQPPAPVEEEKDAAPTKEPA